MVTKIVSKDKVFKEALAELDALLTKWVSDFDFSVTLHGLTVWELDNQVFAQIQAMGSDHPGSELYQLSQKLPVDLRGFVQDALYGAAYGVSPGRLTIQ